MIKDPKFLISSSIGIIGIIVMIALFYAGKSEKGLEYRIVSQTDLVGSHDSAEGIEVSYNGQPISSATIFLVRLTNTGSEPIRKNDFERVIKLVQDGDAKVLNAQFRARSPENLSLLHKVMGNTVIVQPLLLRNL